MSKIQIKILGIISVLLVIKFIYDYVLYSRPIKFNIYLIRLLLAIIFIFVIFRFDKLNTQIENLKTKHKNNIQQYNEK